MEIAAGKFKAECLKLMDTVAATGAEIVITKRGKPVAMLVPPRRPPQTSYFGHLKGSLKILGEIVESDEASSWESSQA